jgi:hypothetical protein
MNGFIPQQATCPHCGILRTVRVGYSGISLCMNCRGRWGSSAVSPNPPIDSDTECQPYPFTPAELARLEIYRRAVAAGFYSE